MKIVAHHRDSGGTYGSPRITANLRAAGEAVSEKTVAKLMAEIGLVGISPRTFKVRTTVVDPDASFPPDLVKRGFDQGRPDAVWSSDITYLPMAAGGNLYLATVIDCCSRRVAGWAIVDHMRTGLVQAALKAADGLRGGLVGSIFHSDHGSQYTSTEFATVCRDLGVTQSMGAVGTSADNALAESFNAALKREFHQDDSQWVDASTCRREVFRWLARYDTKRRHSHCRYFSPATYERVHAPATLPESA